MKQFAASLPLHTTLWSSVAAGLCPSTSSSSLSSSSSSAAMSHRGKYLAHREVWQHFVDTNDNEEEEEEEEEDKSNLKRKHEDEKILVVFEDDVFSALPAKETLQNLQDVIKKIRMERIDFYYLGNTCIYVSVPNQIKRKRIH